MTVNATGLPSWARASSIETFGGDTEKQNKQNVTAFNPRTMTSAEQMSRGVQVLQAAEAVMPFAVLTFECNDTSPAAPTVHYYYGQHGSGTLNAPTAARLGDGYGSFEWDASYTDQYGIEQSIVLTGLTYGIESETPQVMVHKWLSTRKVRFEITNLSSVGVANAKATIVIY